MILMFFRKTVFLIVMFCLLMFGLDRGAFAEDEIKYNTFIVKYELRGENENGYEEFYFDADKSCNISHLNRYIPEKNQVIKMSTMSIIKDGYIYKIDLAKKIGIQVEIPKLNKDLIMLVIANSVLFDKQSFNLEPVMQGEVLGYMCDIYEIPEIGKVFVYNGVILKSELNSGTTITRQATFLEFNCSVDSQKFDVPSDVTIKKISAEAQEDQPL